MRYLAPKIILFAAFLFSALSFTFLNIEIQNEVLISESEVNYNFELENIAFQSTDSILLNINPGDFVIPESGIFSVYLSIDLELEDRNDLLKLKLQNGTIGFNHQEDITSIVGFMETIQLILYVSNQSSNEILQNLDFIFRIEVLEGEFSGICPMVPKDLALLEYDLISTNGEKQSKISYRFNSEENTSDSTKTGDLMVEAYSYELDEIMSKSNLSFICNEEGVLFSGMEVGQMSFNQGNMILIDMEVEFNNNYLPNYPIPGTNLPDAEVRTVADAEPTSSSSIDLSFQMMMNTKVTNRKVISYEPVTVPAGTFDAYRIEYDTNTEFEFNSDNLVGMVFRLLKRRLERVSQGHSIIWYVRDIGFVKQETITSEGTTYWDLITLER